MRKKNWEKQSKTFKSDIVKVSQKVKWWWWGRGGWGMGRGSSKEVIIMTREGIRKDAVVV